MRKGRAFTLIEMLVVCAIILILASLIIPVVSGALDKARYGRWRACSSSLRSDDRLAFYYNFEDGVGTTNIQNQSVGSGLPMYDSARWNCVVQGGYSISRNKSRWPRAGKGGVYFDGTAASWAKLKWGLVSDVTDFSAEAWVKLEAVGTWARLFDFGSGTGSYMFLAPSNGGNSTYSIKAGAAQGVNAPILTAGKWTHVAVTQAGSLAVIYLNGVGVATNASMTVNPSMMSRTTSNFFAKSQFSADPNLNGTIDEFAFYARALKAGEVAAHYANGKP